MEEDKSDPLGGERRYRTPQFLCVLAQRCGQNQAVDAVHVYGRMHGPELALQPGPICDTIALPTLREVSS